MLRGELRDAAADEELGHLTVVEIRADRKRVLGADAVENGQNLILLDKLARERDRLRDVELVIEVLVDDLPAEDAAFGVDVLEVCVRAAADRPVRSGGGR